MYLCYFIQYLILIFLYLMEQLSKQQLKNQKPMQIVWLENQQKMPYAQQVTSDQHDEYLKRQHQAYLAQKLRRKQQMLKNKLQQFGDSSSDSDNQISCEKNATNDSSNEYQVSKTYEYYSGKASSKADSQNEVTLKKVQSVHVSSSKTAENVEVLDIFINSKKGVDVWIQQNLKFKEKIIKFNDFQCSFYDLNKIKIIFRQTADQAFRIKINWNSEQFTFASSRVKMYNELPQVFFVFTKIITEKLEIMNKNKYHEEKILQFPEPMTKKSLIYGKILKKSRLINRWTSVFASINSQGLWYSKKYSEKEKILGKRGQVTQLWTRFEFEEGHLVVKLFENNSKIELAIPVVNFIQRGGWLYHIYNLTGKSY